MIYLDNAATTPPLKEALEYAKKYFEDYYNPSALYSKGIEVSDFLRTVRGFLVAKICPKGYECIFTSGGTESDNTAIFSSVRRGNVVISLGEHSAVYEAVRALENKGIDCRYAPLNADGSVCVDKLLDLVDDKTSLVSVVHVNNETGAINDINKIAALVKQKSSKALFHSDGVQAFGKIPFRMTSDVDFYSASAHKIGGLKGTGMLFKSPNAKLHPLIYGGGQEGGLRSGTENVFGIAAAFSAAKAKYSSISANYEKVLELKSSFINTLDCGPVVISGDDASPYIATLAFSRLKGEVIQHLLERKGVIVGTGSACSSKSPYSRIIKACGYSNDLLDGVVRISFSPENTEEEVLLAAKEMNTAVEALRKVIR